MESTEEPLNLTVKKMPIAIVAPFSFVDSNQNVKIETSNVEDNEKDNNDVKKDDDLPQDLSLNNKNNDFNVDWNKNNKLNVNNTEQLRNYLCKNETQNFYDKNTFNESSNSKNYQYNNVYSFFDNLNNKIPLWYFFNNETNDTFHSSSQYNNKPMESNSILNNLLDKKPQNASEFPTNFGSLIKNEMQTQQNETAKFFDGWGFFFMLDPTYQPFIFNNLLSF